MNMGKSCYRRCNRQQGPCTFCGWGGMCCRKGEIGNGCDGFMGRERYHTCVRREGKLGGASDRLGDYVCANLPIFSGPIDCLGLDKLCDDSTFCFPSGIMEKSRYIPEKDGYILQSHVSHRCVQKLANRAHCDRDSQCLSGNCSTKYNSTCQKMGFWRRLGPLPVETEAILGKKGINNKNRKKLHMQIKP